MAKRSIVKVPPDVIVRCFGLSGTIHKAKTNVQSVSERAKTIDTGRDHHQKSIVSVHRITSMIQ